MNPKLLLTTLALLAPLNAFAYKESGGGARLEGAFRLRAYALIAEVGKVPAANAICPADLMKSSLQATRIHVVDELVADPADTETANLDAWTGPGNMQLLASRWQTYFGNGADRTVPSVDALILHEVFRSIGASCDDDRFELSSRIMQLLKEPGQYDRVFAFTHAEPELGFAKYNTVRTHMIYCDSKPARGERISCVVFWPVGAYQERYEARVLQGVFGSQRYVDDGLDLLITTQQEVFTRLANLAAFASESKPFYLVFHIETGDWSYGYDPSSLARLP